MRELYGGITSITGIKAAGVSCGIKPSLDKDLAVIFCDEPAVAAGVFTTNKVKSAPVLVCKERLKHGKIQAIVANSGNANACTGQQGISDAKMMAQITAQELGIDQELVFVASTGRIGKPLPMDKVCEGIKQAVSKLSYDGGHDAALAIMTTDTFPKEIAIEFELLGRSAKIGGIAKGAGMIEPNMATMLCFITTDVNISHEMLQDALREAVNNSFNMISVDGDMSTNDTVLVMANGRAENERIEGKGIGYYDFLEALSYVTTQLAKMIVKDGEGATKFVELRIKGALNDTDARKAAHAIARSPLLKCALFGRSPNWGRIMSSMGSSMIELDPNKVDIWLNDLKIVENGVGTSFNEDEAIEILKKDEYVISIDLKIGTSHATLWTCDMSYDYVKINVT